MFRKVIKVETEEDLQIQLPKEYLHKEIEITAEEVEAEDISFHKELNDFSDAKAFFSKFQIDMSNLNLTGMKPMSDSFSWIPISFCILLMLISERKGSLKIFWQLRLLFRHRLFLNV